MIRTAIATRAQQITQNALSHDVVTDPVSRVSASLPTQLARGASRSVRRQSAMPPPQADGSDQGAAGAVRSIARPHLAWLNPRVDRLHPRDRGQAERALKSYS